jgi:hypothetical protein
MAENNDNDALEDRELPDESDMDLDDDTETEPCPYCKRAIYEQNEWCPHCGKYISREDTKPSRKAVWIVVGVTVCLVIVMTWVMWG